MKQNMIIEPSNYSISTRDIIGKNIEYDKIINPFNLNTSINYPNDDEKLNSVSFMDLSYEEDEEEKNILVMFKSDTNALNECADYLEVKHCGDERYWNKTLVIDDFNFYIVEENRIVLAYGNSIIVLDKETLEVIDYKYIKETELCIIKITKEENNYIIKDSFDNIHKLDNEFNLI